MTVKGEENSITSQAKASLTLLLNPRQCFMSIHDIHVCCNLTQMHQLKDIPVALSFASLATNTKTISYDRMPY